MQKALKSYNIRQTTPMEMTTDDEGDYDCQI
jgi:hypothetical protein